MWREQAIRAQSFRGPIYQSAPPRPGPNGRPIIERMALGLTEYGPAPFAINQGADLVAIRSTMIDDQLAALEDLSPEERAELARRLTLDGPLDPAQAPVEATEELDPQEDPSESEPVDPASSVELLTIAAAQRDRDD
jgi:hypothetical protein